MRTIGRELKRIAAISCMLVAAVPTAFAGDQGKPSVRPAVDACKLLTGAEIKQVQKTALVETKPSAVRSDAALELRQCFYRAQSYGDSVSVMIGESAKQNPNAVRDFWNETLVKASKTETPAVAPDQMTKADAKKIRHKPEAVPNLGDQAWWVGDQYAGALYVLAGDRFFRLSVGGKAEAKRERTTKLAQAVLKRLKG